MRQVLALLVVLVTCRGSFGDTPVEVEVVACDGGYTLVRGGEPYLVKGAGAVGADLATVSARGGNSIRTWGIEDAQATLDAAQRHGLTTAAVDALQYVWTGTLPANQAPVLQSLRLARRPASDSVRLAAGKRYTAKASVLDPEGDPIVFRWRIKPESTTAVVGGDMEATIGDLDGLIVGDPNRTAVDLVAPGEPSQYRLFLMAFDGHGHAAHGNIPFLVYGKRS